MKMPWKRGSMEREGWSGKKGRHKKARGKKANQTGHDDSRGVLIALKGPRQVSMGERKPLFPNPCSLDRSPGGNVCKRVGQRAKLWETRQVRGNSARAADKPPARRRYLHRSMKLAVNVTKSNLTSPGFHNHLWGRGKKGRRRG